MATPNHCSRCGEYDLQHQCPTCKKMLCRSCLPFVDDDCTECYLEANYKEKAHERT